MTFTITPLELEKFAQRLEQWNGELAEFVVKRLVEKVEFQLHDFRRLELDYHELIALFEKSHPKPSWKDLLA